MGIAERKFRERTAMRKLILQAALDLYLQEGPEHTTMRKIAKKIDYSPTTIYLHYQSKNAILYEMQKMAFAMLLKFLYSNQVQENPYLKLKNLGKAYIEFGVMYPKHYELMFMLRSPMEGVEEEQLSRIAFLKSLTVISISIKRGHTQADLKSHIIDTKFFGSEMFSISSALSLSINASFTCWAVRCELSTKVDIRNRFPLNSASWTAAAVCKIQTVPSPLDISLLIT